MAKPQAVAAVSSLQTKVRLMAAQINQNFPERSEVVDGMITAVIARENCFLLGPPGTAKSAICRAICSAISDPKDFFTWLMNKTTTPEEIFGPFSFKALEQGKYERVSDFKLPKARIAFLDEIFKGNSAILNILLPIINERTFFDGNSPKQIPLQVLFGASNELPQSDELAALYDRFALRYVVDRMNSSHSMMQVWLNPPKTIQRLLSDEELAQVQEEASLLPIPKTVFDKLIDLRRLVHEADIFVSDRKWVQIGKILRAFAYLQGHEEVYVSDFSILADVLWQDPEQRPQINKLLAPYLARKQPSLKIIEDQLEDAYRNYKNKSVDGAESYVQLKEISRELEALAKTNNDARVTELVNRFQKYADEISSETLGL